MKIKYDYIHDWHNLLVAYRKASRGKRGKPAAARFEYRTAIPTASAN